MTRINNERSSCLRPPLSKAPTENAPTNTAGGPSGARTGTIANARRSAATSMAPRVQGAALKPGDLYEVAPMPKGEALEEALRMAIRSNFGYHRDPSQLPEGDQLETKLMDQVMAALGLTNPPGKPGIDPKLAGTYVDQENASMCSFIRDETKQQLVISIPGAGAGIVPGTVSEIAKGNADLAATQYVTNNLGAGLNKMVAKGELPAGCKRMGDIVRTAQQLMQKDPRFKGYELVLATHSMGGPQGETASMMLEKPVRVAGFCTAPVSEGLKAHWRPENLGKVKELLHGIAPENDGVPKLGKPGTFLTRVLSPFGGPMQVGTHHFFPADPKISPWIPTSLQDIPGLNPHVRYVDHFKSYVAGERARANPVAGEDEGIAHAGADADPATPDTATDVGARIPGAYRD